MKRQTNQGKKRERKRRDRRDERELERDGKLNERSKGKDSSTERNGCEAFVMVNPSSERRGDIMRIYALLIRLAGNWLVR